MIKRWIFDNHAFISLAAVVLVATATLIPGYEDAWNAIGATLLGALSFSYFCQQQKLSEILLFKQFFTEFNSRYDSLNDTLSDIQAIAKGRWPDPVQTKRLIDYFNLCAEEFLFRQEGYIPDHVWGSWCRGMLIHLEHHAIKPIWDQEQDRKCYYGLSIEKIEIGARLGG
jgi:hypothetical protein